MSARELTSGVIVDNNTFVFGEMLDNNIVKSSDNNQIVGIDPRPAERHEAPR
jgi:hypothetical protein